MVRALPQHDAMPSRTSAVLLACASLALLAAAELAPLPKAYIDGDGPGWRALTMADFIDVNGDADTWSEKDGVLRCTGKPLGGMRTKTSLRNFELVVEWRHATHGGNSGIFLWCPESAFTDLPKGTLPRDGIEVQVLDLGYEENWKKGNNARSDWFTSHGDVFPVGRATMQAFTPEISYEEGGETFRVGSKTSSRSFPTKRNTKPHGECNHYYVRAVNAEVRLWVNGEEINGGRQCSPSEGYLALESEGALVEYRNLRIRELP